MFIFKSWSPQEISLAKIRSYSLEMGILVLALVLVCIQWFDQKITYLFKEDDWKWLFAREVTNIGLFSHYFMLALLILSITLFLIKFKKSSHPYTFSLYNKSKVLIYTLLYSGLWVHLFKFLFGRQRPKISPDFDPQAFYPFNTHWDFHSLPSGHTQVLFSVATFLAFYFPKYKYLFYFLASLFSFTRVMTRDHFLGDVLAGALVGHLSTVWLYYYLNKKKLL